MVKILVFGNHKGGVGKTCSAVNIGAALARSGKKTLLVDIDPQGNLTTALGIQDPGADHIRGASRRSQAGSGKCGGSAGRDTSGHRPGRRGAGAFRGSGPGVYPSGASGR